MSRGNIILQNDSFQADTLPTLLTLPFGLRAGSACPLILSHGRQLTLAPLSLQLLTEAEDSARTTPLKIAAQHSTDDTTRVFCM